MPTEKIKDASRLRPLFEFLRIAVRNEYQKVHTIPFVNYGIATAAAAVRTFP